MNKWKPKLLLNTLGQGPSLLPYTNFVINFLKKFKILEKTQIILKINK